jgi:excisionase family DNA binding protein
MVPYHQCEYLTADIVVGDPEFLGLFFDANALERAAREPNGPPSGVVDGRTMFCRSDLRTWVTFKFQAVRRRPSRRDAVRWDADSALFTRDEAAKYLSMSVRTFDRERGRGRIATIQVGARLVRFEKRALDAYKASRSQLPVPSPPVNSPPRRLMTAKATNVDWLRSKLAALKRRPGD